MIDKAMPEIIKTKRALETFAELYGENETDSARRRYSSLITEMNQFPQQELVNTDGCLRIFTAPGRTELAGNHTDHNHGKVLAASIQLDCAAVVQKRNDNIIFFRSTGFPDVKIKLLNENGLPDLEPKSGETGTTEALIRGIAAEFHKRGFAAGGFSANADSTVLPGSGLSSSAALEVLFGRIFDSLYGGTASRSPLEIAQIGQIAENAYFGKPCGLMDQTACAAGGAVAIDFKNTAESFGGGTSNPSVKKINFDLSSCGFILCVVNTGTSHADLTSDYASIPSEMKAAAAFFGKSVLGELEKGIVLKSAGEIRKALGDRVFLRALHFFDENERVDAMTSVLQAMEKTDIKKEKENKFKSYLDLVNESGASSWDLLQNVYSPDNFKNQGITTALALTKDFLRHHHLHGACRVHGGGFAGTIQAYVPSDAMEKYRGYMEAVFGAGSVTPLKIRQKGAVEILT